MHPIRRLTRCSQIWPQPLPEGLFEPGDGDEVGPAPAGQDGGDGGVVDPCRPAYFAEAPLAYGVTEPLGEGLGVSRLYGAVDGPVGPFAFCQVGAGRAAEADLSHAAATLERVTPLAVSFLSGMVHVHTGTVRVPGILRAGDLGADVLTLEIVHNKSGSSPVGGAADGGEASVAVVSAGRRTGECQLRLALPLPCLPHPSSADFSSVGGWSA